MDVTTNELFLSSFYGLPKKAHTFYDFYRHTKLSKRFCKRFSFARTKRQFTFQNCNRINIQIIHIQNDQNMTGDLVEKLETNSRNRYYQWNKSHIFEKRARAHKCDSIRQSFGHTNRITVDTHSHRVVLFECVMWPGQAHSYHMCEEDNEGKL